MTTAPAPAPHARPSHLHPIGVFLKATELDTRMLGLVGALLLIWIAFHVLSGGLFLTPRNLWNLSVQSSSVAIMATGMVLVIVTRNIDLSIGSMLGFIGMIMGVTQADLLPKLLGFDHPATWILTLAVGLLLGVAPRRVPGICDRLSRRSGLHRHAGRPARLARRGLVGDERPDGRAAGLHVQAHGRRSGRLDRRGLELGGRSPRLRRGRACCWRTAAPGAKNSTSRFDRWQPNSFLAASPALCVLAAVAIVNAYPWPIGSVRRYAEANHVALPEGGLFIAHGIAIPVLIAIGVGVAMTFLATRTRFGRYVYAIGGNPEAAELAGVNTRWVIMKIFMLMGLLAAIAGAISIARLNAATSSEGTLAELLVIAAAVIGGTSLAGGVGTVAGAMLGAVLMQSLQSGMVLLGVDTPLQSIVVGAVLVVAVWLDIVYRRRA